MDKMQCHWDITNKRWQDPLEEKMKFMFKSA